MKLLPFRAMFPVLALWAALLGQAAAAPLLITNLVLELGTRPRLTIHAEVGSMNRV